MLECDLIMKGGITSGVVYPPAIKKLSETYRFRGIGGTSAGAMATVLTGAAEYRRQKDKTDAGFTALMDSGKALGADLGALMQPSPELAQPFEILRFLVARKGGVVAAIAHAYAKRLRVIGLVGGLVALRLIVTAHIGWALFVILATAIIAVIAVAVPLKKALLTDLPRAGFGLCPGKTQAGGRGPAFVDWLADEIERIAGREGEALPLTIGDLKAYDIELAAMTTDLSTQRPYRLPIKEKRFFVRRSEMERLFAPRIVDYICDEARKKPFKHIDDPTDLYQLPSGDAFPVILVARLSLSFPGLVSAVPIWRADYDAPRNAANHPPMRKLWFSDGGISSNFPMHFFDAPLPSRPTFGIKLGPYVAPHDTAQPGPCECASPDGDDACCGAPNSGVRVDLPDGPTQVPRLRATHIDGVSDFLFAILNTAKDWNDTLQSQLPGYAERIVEIRLKPDEGGLNFEMTPGTVEEIQGYGAQAGTAVVEAFDPELSRYDQHRFQRAVSLAPAAEDMLVGLDAGYRAVPWPGALPYADVIGKANVTTQLTLAERTDVIRPLISDLAALGAKAKAARCSETEQAVSETKVPKLDASLRLKADADRDPGHSEE